MNSFRFYCLYFVQLISNVYVTVQNYHLAELKPGCYVVSEMVQNQFFDLFQR